MTGPHIVTMFLMVKNDMRRFSIIYLTFLSAFSLCTDPFSPLFLLACCAFTCHMFPLVCCALTQDVTSYFINLLVCQLCAVFLFFFFERERERESIREYESDLTCAGTQLVAAYMASILSLTVITQADLYACKCLTLQSLHQVSVSEGSKVQMTK